jgi:hypothetical protein
MKDKKGAVVRVSLSEWGSKTMEWFKRTAQGFSPGEARVRTRPERAAEVLDVRVFARTIQLRLQLDDHMLVDTSRGSVAPSGRSRGYAFPGLKPWAVFLGHFMAQNRHERRQL